MLKFPLFSLVLLERCMNTSALLPRKRLCFLSNFFVRVFYSLISFFFVLLRLIDILDRYQRASGKTLWDAKHEVGLKKKYLYSYIFLLKIYWGTRTKNSVTRSTFGIHIIMLFIYNMLFRKERKKKWIYVSIYEQIWK